MSFIAGGCKGGGACGEEKTGLWHFKSDRVECKGERCACNNKGGWDKRTLVRCPLASPSPTPHLLGSTGNADATIDQLLTLNTTTLEDDDEGARVRAAVDGDAPAPRKARRNTIRLPDSYKHKTILNLAG